MSQSEVLRFVGDLKANPALMAEAGKAAGSLAALVEIGTRRGYAFTLAEAKAHVAARAKATGKTLSDGDLDAAVGGQMFQPCLAPKVCEMIPR
jgi:hypothetical protein